MGSHRWAMLLKREATGTAPGSSDHQDPYVFKKEWRTTHNCTVSHVQLQLTCTQIFSKNFCSPKIEHKSARLQSMVRG